MKAKRVVKKSKLQNFLLFIVFFVFFALISSFLFFTYRNIDIDTSNYQTQRVISTNTQQSVDSIVKDSNNIADVIENTMNSVVGISKLKDNGFSIFSSNNENALGIGTGIIVTNNGYILSNEHVTGSKFSKCYVTLENSSKYDAIVVWSDSDLDLSIIKIDAKNLSPISLGDSDKIRVGETVYAIGNPIGFEFRRTVTSGIISATNRSIKLEDSNTSSYMSDLIQTDATINPGNSGGPLINPLGEVVGINTVKISSADGIGFAIPINVVKGIIDSFKNTGNFDQPTLGIYVYDKKVLPYLNNDIVKFTKGIYVAQIIINGPADNTELKEGDIILSVDGNEINSMNDLREYIFTKSVGDKISLNINRGKINKNIVITLGKK